MEQKKFSLKTLLVVAVLAIMFGIFFTASFDLTGNSDAKSKKGSHEGAGLWTENGSVDLTPTEKGLLPGSFSKLAKTMGPAVVNISTTQVVKGRSAVPFPQFKGPFEDFFGDEFNDFFGGGEKQREFKKESLGSGFLIHKDGYIITNHHVIENATEIIVSFTDKEREEYEAEVIGYDKNIDLALIKIKPKGDVTVAPLGDSDKLEIGEWVVAIGNPYGLGGTVTAGIVSQKGRIIGAGPYDNFIQTDASINPGNSGGPLFNLKGEVIAINTAIIAGGQGLGFAVPINMVKDVLMQLKESGKVTRGWIGVTIQEVTPEIAGFFNLEKPKGALISSVIPEDPAAKAGIKAEDIILKVGDTVIDKMSDLPKSVARLKPNTKTKFVILRDGKEKVVTVTIGTKPDDGSIASLNKKKSQDDDEEIITKKIGIKVQDITSQLKNKLRLDSEDGVLIYGVERGSPAFDAHLSKGDIIIELNRKDVKNISDFSKILKENKKDVILIKIKRGPNMLFVTVNLDD